MSYRRSGFFVIGGVCPLLTIAFSAACALSRPALRELEIGSGLYLATVLGLMIFAALRLNAWQRANPWAPPS